MCLDFILLGKDSEQMRVTTVSFKESTLAEWIEGVRMQVSAYFRLNNKKSTNRSVNEL